MLEDYGKGRVMSIVTDKLKRKKKAKAKNQRNYDSDDANFIVNDHHDEGDGEYKEGENILPNNEFMTKLDEFEDEDSSEDEK
jgi:hypothetical protein